MYASITIFEIIIPQIFLQVKEKRKGTAWGSLSKRLGYFLRKDMQSVHWSMVGLLSWVPTRILSREQ